MGAVSGCGGGDLYGARRLVSGKGQDEETCLDKRTKRKKKRNDEERNETGPQV